jgi:diguanylate cyclase (GGDEF)-like protein/PAS domain S-box-containing protein
LNILSLFTFLPLSQKKGPKKNHPPENIQKEAVRHQSEERYRAILDTMEDGYFEVDLAGNMLFSNEANNRLFGYGPGEQIGMNYREYTEPETAKNIFEIFNKVYRTGIPRKGFEWEVRDKKGNKVQVETSVSLMRDADNQPAGFRGILRDITQKKQMESALRQSEERYRTILNNMEEGYFEVDLAGNLLFCNEAHAHIYGFSQGEMNGLNFRDYLDPENAQRVYKIYNRVFQTGEPEKVFDFELIKKDGGRIFVSTSIYVIRDSKGQKIGFRGVIRDITRQKQVEETLKALSLIDDLTGLYNRRGFLTLAEQTLKTTKRMNRGAFLIFTDLDDLKWINDTYGHLEGDEALIMVSRIIRENFREPDIMARIGGDEFVILAVEGAIEAGPELFLERLQKGLLLHNENNDRPYSLSLSMGISSYHPEQPISIEALLDQADKNMYRDKQQKKKSIQLQLGFYPPESDPEFSQAQRIAHYGNRTEGHGR